MTSATALSIGDAVTAIDGSKWHVLENSGSGIDTVVLLSDYNLNSDGSYNIKCNSIDNSTYECNPIEFDIDNTNIYDETDSNNIGYFIHNVYTPKVIQSLPGTIGISLPTADQIAIADGKIFNSNEYMTLSNDWLCTTNYWTKTSSSLSKTNVWNISGHSKILSDHYAAQTQIFFGIRPVITTLKANLFN